ncbi:hypothetical protein [Leifsonia xyli]|uniref:hypothetical protein n=1 Tax=Leifsonia xyli TaxID=1575 RepID=UPI003D66B74F
MVDSSRAKRSVPALSFGQQMRQTQARSMMPAVHHPASGPIRGSTVSAATVPVTTPIATQINVRRAERSRPAMGAPDGGGVDGGVR